MRIGIDARLNAYRGGGIPQYTRQLLNALALLATEDELFSLQHYRHRQPLVDAPHVRRSTLFTPPHHTLEQWSLPIELTHMQLDVLHCPDFIAPNRLSCPSVVTIHDLAFLHYPNMLDSAAYSYYSKVRDSVWRADAVIAVSKATSRDISLLLDLPPKHVDVVYEAAAPSFRQIEVLPDETRLIPRIDADKPTPYQLKAYSFALFVSTLEPRKNLPTLLQALRICIDRFPDIPFKLVVVGARGWKDEAIFETVRDLRLSDSLVFLGHIEQEDLNWLYNACVVYANPSLYEGFGLPVLEAMTCGAPALVASTGSLPEIVGDAAMLLPPLDAEAWAQGLKTMWVDEQQRHDFAQRGPTQAALFSWERAARETLAIYHRVHKKAKKP